MQSQFVSSLISNISHDPLYFVFILFPLLLLFLTTRSRGNPTPSRSSGKCAVVIGASISGLVNARILSEHYEKVYIVERDKIILSSAHHLRAGVPQGAHVHVALSVSTILLKKWFPKLIPDLLEVGSKLIDGENDPLQYFEGSWLRRRPSDDRYPIICCRRPVLESMIRKHVLEIPNVELIDECTVSNFIATKNEITGIRYYTKDSEKENELASDLVVDCSGKNSHTPKWLPKLGFKAPEQKQVNSYVTYSTCILDVSQKGREGGTEGDWECIAIYSVGKINLKSFSMCPIDGVGLMATAVSFNNDPVPTTFSEFLENAKNFPPLVYDILKDAKLLSGPVFYKNKGNIRNYYEKVQLPSGLLVSGDSVASFTPVYAQGISVACLEAEQLKILLEQNTPTQKLSSEFFLRMFPIIDSAWNLATNSDMKDPRTVGKRSFFMTLILKYFAILMHLGNNDSSIHRVMFDVMHMRQLPTAIMKPKFIFYALLYLIGLKKDGKTDQPFPSGGPKERIVI